MLFSQLFEANIDVYKRQLLMSHRVTQSATVLIQTRFMTCRRDSIVL